MTVIQPPGVQWVVNLLQLISRNEFFSWEFHLDDRDESSSTYDTIIGNGTRSSWTIRHYHEPQ
jgi:hypothetical protein